MHLRKQHNFIMVSEDEAEETGYDDEIIKGIEAKYIFLEIANLPTGYRTVLNLYCIEGYKHQEIAEILNIKEGTSRSQLNKAKKLLKERLDTNIKKDERRRL
jgi:RNA polymerase sigma-70 factor (ECF subfamily)